MKGFPSQPFGQSPIASGVESLGAHSKRPPSDPIGFVVCIMETDLFQLWFF
jgi:hypothetical protein